MKLLYCYKCNDIVRLQTEERKCSCGLTSGKYLYRRYAEYSGDYAVPLWINDAMIKKSARKWGDKGRAVGVSLHFINRGDQHYAKKRVSPIKLKRLKFQQMSEEQFSNELLGLDSQYEYAVVMQNKYERKRKMDADSRQRKILEFKQLQEDIMFNRNALLDRKQELVVTKSSP
jgi:hypothetical protein